MAVTAIGNSADLVCISDNATPSSGTYAWYLPATTVSWAWPSPYAAGSRQDGPGGVNAGAKDFTLNITWSFRRIPVRGLTDYQNLLKALFTWNKNNTKLYLSFTPAGYSSTNLATAAAYSAPTTLTQITGRLQGLRCYDFTEGVCFVDVDMPYLTV